MFSAASRREHVTSALHAEILALLFGLDKLQVYGYKDVALESDSLVAI